MAGERVTVTGNIGREPERRSTSRGEVVEFSVACTPRQPREGGGWADGETVWYRVSAWDRLGRNAAASLHRGQPVIVHGLLRTDGWTGQDGVVRPGRDIKAFAIGHDLGAGTATFVRSAPGAAAPAQAPVAQAEQRAPAAQDAPVRVPAPQQPAPAGWTAGHAAEEVETPF